jgi:hypothetical protein
VGKVSNLCRVLETGISAELMVKSSLDSFMMMVNNDVIKSDLWYFLF